MMVLQSGMAGVVWRRSAGAGFVRSAWVAATHFTTGGEPDLIGFSIWLIFLSLGFFTVWALVGWIVSVAPILMLLEELFRACRLFE